MMNPASRLPVRPAALVAIGVIGLLVAVIGLEINHLLDRAAQAGSVWHWSLVATLVVCAVGCTWWAVREWAAFTRLRRVGVVRQWLHEAGDDTPPAAVHHWFDSLRRQHDDLDAAVDHVVDAMARGTPVAEAVRTHLLPELRSKSDAIIRRESLRAGVLASVLPIPLADALVSAALSIRVIRKVATVHGARPGVVGTWQLVRATATVALAADVTQHAADALSAKVGTLVASAGQGVVVAALVARVGLWTQHVCSPMSGQRAALGMFAARGAAAGVRSTLRRGVSVLTRWRRRREGDEASTEAASCASTSPDPTAQWCTATTTTSARTASQGHRPTAV